MKSIFILNDKMLHRIGNNVSSFPITVKDMNLHLASIKTPSLNNKNIDNDQVIIEIDAFSCNYRDVVRLYKAFSPSMPYFDSSKEGLIGIGSDFVGRIVKKGDKVIDFEIGDRVIPDNNYTGLVLDGQTEGVVTNIASIRHQVALSSRLIKIPPEIDNNQAASLSINSQTAFSMVRKAQIHPHDAILITSASSNTSIAILKCLLAKGFKNVIGLTTTPSKVEPLLALGYSSCIWIKKGFNSFGDRDYIRNLYGTYDVIFDPNFDVNFRLSLNIINPGGRYITCGMLDQYRPELSDNPFLQDLPLAKVLTHCLINNISLIGNCVGLTSDLTDAIELCRLGMYQVEIDSVYDLQDADKFFNRTFFDDDRMGKVVLKYD